MSWPLQFDSVLPNFRTALSRSTVGLVFDETNCNMRQITSLDLSSPASAQTVTGQQIKWWQTKLAGTIGGVPTAAGGAATIYKVMQQWHCVDKLAEDIASLKEDVHKRFDKQEEKLDKQEEKLDKLNEKLDKVLEMIGESNNQPMTTRKQFVKLRRRMVTTVLRVAVLERNRS